MQISFKYLQQIQQQDSDWGKQKYDSYIGTFIEYNLTFLEDGSLRENQCDCYVMWSQGEWKGFSKFNINFFFDRYNIGDTTVWGAVKIKLDSTEELGPSIVHRHLKVSIEGDVEEHSVTQIHWSGWIDQSVPQSQDFELLLQIINLIVTRCLQNQKVVFHCSAGIGRTGTLISLCNIMMTLRSFMTQVSNDPKEILNNPESFKLSIFGTVRRLREQRWGMVHTPEQYNYLYKFIEKVMNSFLEKQ